MRLDKVGDRSWRFHGMAPSDWFNVNSRVALEAGVYVLSGEVSDPHGKHGGYVQIQNATAGYVQLTPYGSQSVRFEVADRGSSICSLNCRRMGDPVDLTVKHLSLVRIL